MQEKRWWRGLFARVTLAYAIGSLLLSSTVALLTLTIAQNRLLSVEEEQAQAQFLLNVGTVRPELEVIAADFNDERRDDVYRAILADEIRRFNSSSLLITPDGPRGTLSRTELAEAAEPLLTAVESGDLASYRYLDGEGNLFQAYGIAFRAREGQQSSADGISYYEVHDFNDLASTLRTLRLTLLSVATIASIAGTALGYYSARRALAPLASISKAAQAIADGDFKTRLDLQADRDLAVLSSSFNEMVDALSLRIERDEQFASDVSHELRSPLMTLTASVVILERRRSSLPEVVQQAVGLLRSDLTRFVKLVEDLLEISRLDAGAVELQSSDFRLAVFLLNVVAQSRSPEIEILHDPEDADLTLSADKRRMAQVVTNLIDNAKKYAGGATHIEFMQIGDCVQIVVVDNGPGVALADRKRIFQRFSRADADAGRRGHRYRVGLGLSLVAEHVRLHDGSVWVTDRADGQPGARFVVELPVRTDNTHGEEMAI